MGPETKTVRLEESSKSSLQHQFRENEVVPGGIYSVTVKTDKSGSKPSPEIKMRSRNYASYIREN